MSEEQGGPTPEEMGIGSTEQESDQKFFASEEHKIFSSTKVWEVNRRAEKLIASKDAGDNLQGDMINELIMLSARNSAVTKADAERELDRFNFDDLTGEKLDPQLKAAAIQKAMESFDDLQDMRLALTAIRAKELR